jgi:hypothetical protein
LGIDPSKLDAEHFRIGLDKELEPGQKGYHTNVTNDDPIKTGKIALAHLNEFSVHYTTLKKLEKEAEKHWAKK